MIITSNKAGTITDFIPVGDWVEMSHFLMSSTGHIPEERAISGAYQGISAAS